MAFRPKFYAGATTQDIRQAMNPTSFIAPDSYIDGIRWMKILSDGICIKDERCPEIHLPNEHSTGNTANGGSNNQHYLPIESDCKSD